MINNQQQKWLSIQKGVITRFWDNLPWHAREVIAADTEGSSRSLEYFSKAVNRETDRIFRESFNNN
jgi:hypothetical protein